MIPRLSRFLIVALITALIWIVAESASLRSQTLSTTLQVTSTPDFAVSVTAPASFESRAGGSGECSITVDGATSRLDAAAIALRSTLRLEPGQLGIPREAGEHVIDLRSLLQSSPALQDSGVRVSSAQPASITLRIEPIVARTIPIRVLLPELDLEGAADVAPAQASIHLSESLAASLAADATAIAEVDAASLRGMRAGQRHTAKNIAVRLPASLQDKPGVRLDTLRADVAFTVRSSIIQRPLPDVPVLLRCDPAILAEWDIQLDPASRTLHNVQVTGPPSTVAELLSKGDATRPPVSAFVTLTKDDLARAEIAGGTLVKDAAIADLPSSLTFDIPTRAIRLQVKRRGPGS